MISYLVIRPSVPVYSIRCCSWEMRPFTRSKLRLHNAELGGCAALAFRDAGSGQDLADLRDAQILACGVFPGQELRGLFGLSGHLAERGDGLNVGFGAHALPRFAANRRDADSFLFALVFGLVPGHVV